MKSPVETGYQQQRIGISAVKSGDIIATLGIFSSFTNCGMKNGDANSNKCKRQIIQDCLLENDADGSRKNKIYSIWRIVDDYSRDLIHQLSSSTSIRVDFTTIPHLAQDG